MAVSGRKPNLPAQRTRAGHREHPEPPPESSGVPLGPPPEDLPPRAAEIWDELVPELDKLGVYRPQDRFLLAELCFSLALAQAFRNSWTRHLESTDDASTLEMKRLRTGYVEALDLARKLAADLGIPTVERVRLGLAKLQGASLLAGLENL